MIKLTGVNSISSIFVIGAFIWNIISIIKLRRYYAQKYIKSKGIKKNVMLHYKLGNLLIYNPKKEDRKLNKLIWLARISIILFIIGIILTLI